MLKHHIRDCGVVIGTGAGKDILGALENARRSIKIVSPYVSSEFLDLLLTKKQHGVEVRLVVSSDLAQGQERTHALKKLIRQEVQVDYAQEKQRKESMDKARVAGWGIWLALALGFWFSVPGWWLLAIAFLPLHYKKVALRTLVTHAYRYSTTLPLRIVPSPYEKNRINKANTLIHTKLFIIDDSVAFLGSVNFTKAAFFFNYETRITVTSPESIAALNGEFQGVFAGGGMPCMDIAPLGRSLYGETRNG